MANDSRSENNGNVGNQSSIAGAAGRSDDIIRIDPGAIDADAGTAQTPNVETGSGRGPNGRKLNKDGTERKAKGSRSGNASPGPTASASFPVEALAANIVATHAILAATLRVPELNLDPREGQQLAAALANLQRFYPVVVSEKALAWGQVFSALGLVYGTRFMAMGARKKADAKSQPQSATILRPDFQARPTVQTPQPAPTPAQSPPVTTPDGDNLPGTFPQNVTQSKSVSPSEKLFSATPPEFM